MLNDISAVIGTVLLAGGGGGAVVFYLFKLFGEKWLNTKLEERLASFRHEQQKEIEHLRFRINTLMDRTAKLHQWEFDVLPEAWGRLNDAFNTIRGLGFRLDQNLDGIPEEQLNEFLNKSPLTSLEQTQLKTAANKTEYYARCMDVYLLKDALAAYNSYEVYVRKNGIFIERSLLDTFHEIDKLMIEALDGQHLKVGRLPFSREKIAAVMPKAQSLIVALEREVQRRLWNADSIP
jgi:hypothetical protein